MEQNEEDGRLVSDRTAFQKTLLAVACVAIGLCGLMQIAQAGSNYKWVQLVPDGDTTIACASVRVMSDTHNRGVIYSGPRPALLFPLHSHAVKLL